ncbi:MAG: hypothetical protein JO001_12935 [Alphaproteobacteria bacterium]|nr:hypothetical protein [Alphaproteobacteria bacterium]
MIDRPLVALLAGCAVFAGLIVFELLPDMPDPRAPEIAPAAPAPALAKPPAKVSAAALSSTVLAAPLFSPTRHPPDASGGPSNSELNDVRLSGIVVEPDRRLAIFAVPGGKAMVRGEGEELNGWRLDSISEIAVSLSGPGGARTLEPRPDQTLVRSAPARPVPAAVSAAPPQPASAPPTPGGGGTPRLTGPLRPLRPSGGAAPADAGSAPHQ